MEEGRGGTVGGKLVTSANIRKDTLRVVCRREGVVRRKAGRDKERGQQVQVVQVAVGNQQALAAVPALALPGRNQHAGRPHCALPTERAQVQP